MGPVRKAIIPAAGFGTRFLPVAKSVPKEMIPVVDRPVIQYVVEEAVAAGITDILFVVSRGKRPLEEYFHACPELEAELAAKQKAAALEQVQRLNSLARIHFTWQQEMRGLGDAVRHGAAFAGDEPVAVLLGDTILEPAYTAPAITKQLVDAFAEHGGSAVAVEEVPAEKVSRYGIAGGTVVNDRILRTDRWVEKPSPETAPSRLAVSARYVFTPQIFRFLADAQPGLNGEIQLTDAMHRLAQSEPMFAVRIAGQRFDVGNPADFIRANVHFALKRPDTADAVRKMLSEYGGI